MLIHCPTTDGKIVETYEALLEIKQQGLIRFAVYIVNVFSLLTARQLLSLSLTFEYK